MVKRHGLPPEAPPPPAEPAAEPPAVSIGTAARDFRFQHDSRTIAVRKDKKIRADRALRSYIDAHRLPVTWEAS